MHTVRRQSNPVAPAARAGTTTRRAGGGRADESRYGSKIDSELAIALG